MLNEMRGWKPSKPLPTLDHQGISSWIGPRDPTSGRFSYTAAEGITFYFDGRNWTKLVTIIAN
jgi:hypothetical protein